MLIVVKSSIYSVDKRDVLCESVVHKYVNSNQQVTIARSKTSQNEEFLPTSSRTLLPACKGVVLYCVIFPGIAYDSHLLSVYWQMYFILFGYSCIFVAKKGFEIADTSYLSCEDAFDVVIATSFLILISSDATSSSHEFGISVVVYAAKVTNLAAFSARSQIFINMIKVTCTSVNL